MTNHKTARRTATFLLAVLLLLPALVSCGKYSAKPVKPSKDDLRVVATCNGFDIYYEELRYITMTYKEEFSLTYGEGIWDDPVTVAQYAEKLKAEVERVLPVNAAILSMAAEYDIDINCDEIQDAVQADIEQTIRAMGGRSAYLAALEEMYLTDHFARFSLAADKCETELCYVLIDLGVVIEKDTDFLTYALNDENFCATYHVFIGNDPGDSVEENRKTAELVLEKLDGGADFRSMIGSKYNEDVDEVSTPYYFTHGEMDRAYEDAAFALDIGEYSGIIETDAGFFIIWRQPLSEAYIVANITTLKQQYQFAEIESLLEDIREGLTVEWTEFGASLDLTAMK